MVAVRLRSILALAEKRPQYFSLSGSERPFSHLHLTRQQIERSFFPFPGLRFSPFCTSLAPGKI